MFQSFSVFYRQQYSAAYFSHLHQEVEPKKEGRGLLLTPGVGVAPVHQSTLVYSNYIFMLDVAGTPVLNF